MKATRFLLHAAITLTLSAGIFALNLLLSAKPLYALYADLFQLGQTYHGETRALMYNRYIFTAIIPCSFLFGSALTWLLMARGWVAFVSATLVLIAVLLAAALLRLEPVVSSPTPLRNHPDANWSRELDGGAFFEITHAEPPRYFVEIRYENDTLWAQCWVTGPKQGLTSSDFLGYYGGDTVELKNGRQLRLEDRDGSPIHME